MNYTEPHIPTPEDIIPTMLSFASVKPDETVFDLGSGDARIVIVAARDFHANAVGVETRKRLVKASRKKVRDSVCPSRAKITCRNFKKVSLRKVDVLCTYLSSYTLNLLTPKFSKELRPGVRIGQFRLPHPRLEGHEGDRGHTGRLEEAPLDIPMCVPTSPTNLADVSL